VGGREVVLKHGRFRRVYSGKDPELGSRLNTYTRVSETLNLFSPTQVLMDVGVWNYGWKGSYVLAEAQLLDKETERAGHPVFIVWLNEHEWYIGSSVELLRRVAYTGINPSAQGVTHTRRK
jgi:hypothetical protein